MKRPYVRARPLAALATSAALCACNGGLAIEPPETIQKVEATCMELADSLPETVLGELTRETKPESDLTAAWGTPAIVLRCGVSPPSAATPSAELVSIEGVDWFAEEVPEGYIFTSWGRLANVEVTVPDDYSPEADPLVELAPAIKAVDPKA
jgi:Protein of unknown function (DUF3515)